MLLPIPHRLRDRWRTSTPVSKQMNKWDAQTHSLVIAYAKPSSTLLQDDTNIYSGHTHRALNTRPSLLAGAKPREDPRYQGTECRTLINFKMWCDRLETDSAWSLCKNLQPTILLFNGALEYTDLIVYMFQISVQTTFYHKGFSVTLCKGTRVQNERLQCREMDMMR